MRLAGLTLTIALLSAGMVVAQPRTQNPEPERGTRNPEPGTVEVDPIECWWRTSATAVRVGETFNVVLTCSVLQTEAARVVADESRLEPTVVQLPPFEVVGGTHPQDVITAGRRFFQYSYQLRVIAENVFAAVVALPALEITYKVESRTDLGDSLAGRDQTYALPTLAIRVLSVVPDTATDIREAPVATFGDLEDTAFRGAAMRIGGWVLIALGGLLLVLALAGLFRRRRTDAPKTHRFSDTLVLRGVRRELVSIQEQSRNGWTSELAGRALAALRVVAAYASGRPVTQKLHTRREARSGTSIAPSDGQLAIDGRFGTGAVVSAAATSSHAEDELRDALAQFAAARYGRDAGFDARLDDGLEAGIRVADRLIGRRPTLERLWPR
jgi:hypothetical protein